jgi:hypothetical protein
MGYSLTDFVARLADFGVHVELGSTLSHPSDVESTKVRLSRGGSRQEYALLLRQTVTLSDLGVVNHDIPTMVAARFVSPRSADSFRRAGVQYIDAVGNAWVEFDDVLIDVRGRRPPGSPEVRQRVAAGNLFSTARAQVAFTLLAWPELWEAPQRQVAHAAGVSLGQANNALALFREAGFGLGVSGRPAELLDLWAAAFPSGLAQKLTLATYRGSVGSMEKVHAEDAVFVSGEAAAGDLLRPASLTIYVEQLDQRLPIVNRWRSDGPPNIVVRRKFWAIPESATHDYDRPITALRNAPWPLVYSDLLASDDPRVRGAAREWRKQFARLEQNT